MGFFGTFDMLIKKNLLLQLVAGWLIFSIKWLDYEYIHSLRSRREWVPARTSVPNVSAKSRSGREKNGEESSWIPIIPISRTKPARELAASTKKVSRAHPLPPATQANTYTDCYLLYQLKRIIAQSFCRFFSSPNSILLSFPQYPVSLRLLLPYFYPCKSPLLFTFLSLTVSLLHNYSTRLS